MQRKQSNPATGSSEPKLSTIRLKTKKNEVDAKAKTIKMEREINARMGEEIRKIRRDMLGDISGKELAKMMGVVPQYVKMWESGVRKITDETIERISTIGKSPKQQRAIYDRLMMARIRTWYPDTAAALENMHVHELDEGDPRAARFVKLGNAIQTWCEEHTKTTPRHWVTKTLNCHEQYAEKILKGVVLPTRDEVRTLEKAALGRAKKWSKLAGYAGSIDLRQGLEEMLSSRGVEISRETVGLLERMLLIIDPKLGGRKQQ